MILSDSSLCFCYPGCQKYSHRKSNIRKHQLCKREHRTVLSNSSFIWVEHWKREFFCMHRTQQGNKFLCSNRIPGVFPLPYSASDNCKAMIYIKEYLDISKEIYINNIGKRTYRNTLIAPRWIVTLLWQNTILNTDYQMHLATR